MATDSFGEINRKFFDEHVKELFEQEWVYKMSQQLRDCLQSNVGWIGIRKRLDNEPPVKMIDYACGNGLVTQSLSNSADIIRGVDISEGMVKAYNEVCQKSGVAPERMHAVRGNFLDSSSGDAISGPDFHDVDVIITSMALHHVADPAGLISKMTERLRSNGVMVFLDWMTTAAEAEHGWSHVHNHHHGHHHHVTEKSLAAHTINKTSFSADDMKKFFTDAGCNPDTFDFRPYKETSHLPESVTKVEGGVERTFFIAKARKA